MTAHAAFDEFVRIIEIARPSFPVAKFGVGYVVRCEKGGFRGVVLDVDACFDGPSE